jgi:hypothetical protein
MDSDGGTNNINIVPASIIQVALGADSTQTVYVAITNAAGTAFVDRPFHLAVHC